MNYDEALNYLSVNGKLGLILQENPHNWGVYSISEGDVSADASRGQLSGNASCLNFQGFCTGAVEYRFKLEPNERVNVVFKAPIERLDIEPSVINQLREADFDSHLQQVKTSWKSFLFSGMKISLPEEQVVNNFYASLAYQMILEDGKEFHAGPSVYDAFYFRDGAYMVNALDKLGFFKEAEASFRNFLERQRPDGWFYSQDTEWDSNGQAMWALVQQFQLTGNVSWLQEVYPNIRKGALWLKNKRKGGLLPGGKSAEDIGDWTAQHYWDDFWGIRGIKSAIYAANVLNETEDIEWLIPEYNDFLNDTLESIKKTMEAQKISHIPCGPTHGFRNSQAARGTSVGLWPTQALNVSDKLVQDSFNHYWSAFFVDGGFIHGGTSPNCFWPYVTMGLAHDFMLLGWDDKALSSFRWVLNNTVAPSAWPELMDENIRLGALGGGWGDQPHGWATAEYILLVRDMLLMEDGSKLLLTPCIDPSWLADGSIISVKDAPTYFGEVSFFIQSHLDNGFIEVFISPEQDPPDGYILELPTLSNITAVDVNGKPFTNYNENLIYLPPGSREVTVWYKTKPPEFGTPSWKPSEPSGLIKIGTIVLATVIVTGTVVFGAIIATLYLRKKRKS